MSITAAFDVVGLAVDGLNALGLLGAVPSVEVVGLMVGLGAVATSLKDVSYLQGYKLMVAHVQGLLMLC